MTTSNTLSSFAITSRELAYLLALVGATGLTGVDHPHLTPGAQADAVYDAGRAGLEARGWLTRKQDGGAYQFDAVAQGLAFTLAYPTHLIAVLMPHRLLQYYVSEQHTLRLTSADRDAFEVTPMASPRDCGADIVAFCGLDQHSKGGTSDIKLLVMRVKDQRIADSREAEIHAGDTLVFKVSASELRVPADAGLGDKVTGLIAELMRALA